MIKTLVVATKWRRRINEDSNNSSRVEIITGGEKNGVD